jgi:hypothetical protein
MATATAPRLTKPRLSALILEGTAFSVSLVLVLWLLLWFMWRHAGSAQIEAFFVQPESDLAEEAPYQSADVRRLRGSLTFDSRWETKPSELLEAVRGIVTKGGQALVIYINEPVVAAEPGIEGGQASREPVSTLIKTVARETRRDVVLALDLAQVDSDRDLGVFGNSPYEGLAEQMREIPDGERSAWILTSCAPAQKSWSTDGLGQSAFSFYLRKGLEGDARDWDTSSPGLVTATGLHRYVLAHVSAWAKKNCRAIQTPMLIPVGKNTRNVTLPILPRMFASTTPPTELPSSVAPASSAPKENEQAKETPVVKEKAKASPSEQEMSNRESLLKDLLDEWKQHDTLRDQKPPPYRDLPGAWRYYQATLMQAERRLRAAWFNGDRINPSRDLLTIAKDQRLLVEARLKKQRDDEAKFPFRPAKNTVEGKKEIEEALIYLTGVSMAGGAASSSEPSQGAGARGSVSPAPPCLREIAEGGYPQYLELQLPIWATRFMDTFRRGDYFKNDTRAKQLSRLVDERSKAEQTLAIDHRGNRYVQALIESGDRDRRQLQDELFAVSGVPGNPQVAKFASRIIRVAVSYDAALNVIKVFQEAREALEKIAAEFPDMADWLIRSRSHALSNDSTNAGESMARLMENMIESLRHLIQALDRGVPGDQSDTPVSDQLQKLTGELKSLTQAAREALEALDGTFAERTRPEAANDWVARELALRTPLLRYDRRAILLKAVLEANEEVHVGPSDESTTELATHYPHDTGFWVRAAGLARLDLDLDEVSRGNLGKRATLSQSLNEVLPAKGTSIEDRESALRLFSDISKQTRIFRDMAFSRPSRRGEHERSLDEIEKQMRRQDWGVRFLSRGEIRHRGSSGIDEPVVDYHRFGQYATLLLHFNRLTEDYVYFRQLDELWNRIENLGKSLGVRAGLQRQRAGQSLKIEVTPPSPIREVGPSGEVSFQVRFSQPEDSTSMGSIPKGKALIGVVGPTDGSNWELMQVGVPPDVLGTLVDVPPTIPPQDPIPFRVSQKDLSDRNLGKLSLEATAFYRGRVDAGGTFTIVVAPKFFEEIVRVSITQDYELLADKYNKDVLNRIEDQFKVHPFEGVMHKGKKLAYVLKVENVSPRGLKVKCQRFLLDPKTDTQKKLDQEPRIEELKPGQKMELRGEITSQDVPPGNPKQLKLTVLDEKGKELSKPPLSVKFKQIEVSEYMKFEELNKIDEFEGQKRECYVVKYIRRSDDPVTEPILGSEISCTIEGLTGKKVELRDDYPIFPGESVKSTHPSDPSAKQWKWSGKIENEDLPARTVTVR